LLEIVRDDTERGTFGPAFRQHLGIPLLLVLFAAAFAYGPARSVTNGALRRVLTGCAFALPLVLYAWLKPSAVGAPSIVALSTSQWISLITALWAAFAWHKAEQAPAPDQLRLRSST
jgi:hypothetical protein